MSSRDQCISALADGLIAGQSEVWEAWQRGGARAVAEAACPGGSEGELQRLAAQAERWARKAAQLPPFRDPVAGGARIAALTTGHERREEGGAA
jgi:hypothetical protein